MRADYGYLAEFASIPSLLAAIENLRSHGYTRLEAYSPFPVEGLAEAMGTPHNRIPLAMLLGGLVGGASTLALQYYSAVIDYPIDVGGRPAASWPAFVPAALEMTLLVAALAGAVAMLVGSGLGRLHHPLFESTRFNAVTRDGLFLLVRSDDPKYDGDSVLNDLTHLDPIEVERIAA
jgi:Alternative complex III, ActD subunit